MEEGERSMMKEIGDFPLWAVLCGLLPAVVVFWLGVGYAGTLLVYLGVTGLLAVLSQLDSIEHELKIMNERQGGGD
jgi:hypothetical protein